MTWSVNQMPRGFTLLDRKRNEKRPQQAGGDGVHAQAAVCCGSVIRGCGRGRQATLCAEFLGHLCTTHIGEDVELALVFRIDAARDCVGGSDLLGLHFDGVTHQSQTPLGGRSGASRRAWLWGPVVHCAAQPIHLASA